MLSILSKNKSFTTISIEKGVLETHGIKSWIWDSDGCLWYGEQGAIRCRLAVREEDLDEATKILNSASTKIPDTAQSEELPATKTASPPYFTLTFCLGLLFILILNLLNQTTLEPPSFIKEILAFPIYFFVAAETFVFLSLGIPPTITNLFITLINIFLTITIGCIVIGNRIPLYVASSILALAALLTLPWIAKSTGIGVGKVILLLIENLYIVLLVALLSLTVSWGLNLVGFNKMERGALKALGFVFVHFVTWPTIISLIIYYTPSPL